MDPEARQSTRMRRVARFGLDKVVDRLLGAVLGAALTVVLVSAGVRYEASEDRLDEAARVASLQAGGSELADGYEAFARARKEVEAWVEQHVPEPLHESLKGWSLAIAGATLVGGIAFAMLRAPSRAVFFKQLGEAILSPGLWGAFAMLVLEWRAMKGIKATLAGERTWAVLFREGQGAAREAGAALWPALVGGTVAIACGLALHRRWHGKKQVELAPAHVLSHFLVVVGLVPWIHYVAAIVVDAVTVGRSTGASIAPWVEGPVVYVAFASMFSFGAALWLLARHEVKRLDRLEGEADAKKG